MAFDLWSKTERIPETHWGVGERKMFKRYDGLWWEVLPGAWLASIVVVGIITLAFQRMGFEFYGSAAYNLLGSVTPGIKLHTPGAANKSVAGVMWVYGTYTTPLIFWLTMRKVQNFRIPKVRKDRIVLLLCSVSLLLVSIYVFHPRLVFVNAIPLGHTRTKSVLSGMYSSSTHGLMTTVSANFLCVYLGLTLTALHVRAIWRQRSGLKNNF